MLQLTNHDRAHLGIGSPPEGRWLFPGLLPRHPITASRLADRLRALGIPTQAGRRATLTDLAAQLPATVLPATVLPATVLADLVNPHPTTAVKWMRQAGDDWTRYAAELARTRNHQPSEQPQPHHDHDDLLTRLE